MKAIRITGPHCAEVFDVPDPKAAADYVVVKILAAPMCTEYKMYHSGHPAQRLGHEAAGEVVEVAQPGRVRVGDRVVVMPQLPCGTCYLCLRGDYIHCQNGRNLQADTGYAHGCATYAQYILKPESLLVPVPDGMPIDHAGMACCGLGPTFGAMEHMGIDAFDTVLVTGLGPVGLGAIVNGVFRGARVLAVEGHPYRAKLGLELGAEAVLDPADPDTPAKIRDLTAGIGVDAGIDCSGVAAAQRLLIDSTRRKGHVTFVGEAGDLTIHVSNDMIRKGLTLYGDWHWNIGDSPRILQVIRESAALLEKQITHRFPLDRVSEAFELQVAGNCGKIILHPWD